MKNAGAGYTYGVVDRGLVLGDREGQTAFRIDAWMIFSWVVMLAYALLGYLALDVAIDNHAAGLATSIMDGVDSLGLSDMWELQANVRESRIYMQLMMWGFLPSDGLFSLFFGDTWMSLYFDLLYSVLVVLAGAVLVQLYAIEFLRDSRAAALMVVLYFLLPAAFANTVYWYGQPVFVMVMGALYLLRRGWTWPAVGLIIWAHGCHPMTAPVFLGLAWASFRMRLNGRDPILPGLDRRDATAIRTWRISLVLVFALSVWTVFLVVMSKLGDSGSTRGLLWEFFRGKFDPSTLPRNFSQTFFFYLPMLFLPFFSWTWLPSLVVFTGYMLIGSQGVVTGFMLPAAGFAMLAAVYSLKRWSSAVRAWVVLAAIVAALLTNALVPWPAIFPMYPEPVTGGVLATHSWSVQADESAMNAMIREQIPKGTARCLTTWQIGPVMAERCRKVTTLSFPFRRHRYELQDFLDFGDRGRLDTGWWNFILVDLHREEFSPGLKSLVQRVESSGRWEVAGRTSEAVLYRRIERSAE